MKRALYVWQSRYPWDVRVEKICLSLAENGYETDILARRSTDEPETDRQGPITIHRVGSRRGFEAQNLPLPWSPAWKAALQRVSSERKPDIIIARDIPLAISCANTARKIGVPMIIDMAEHYPEAMRVWKKYQSSPFLRFAVNTLKIPDYIEKKSVQAAQGIITVCAEQKERLVRSYGCDPKSIVPILNTPHLKKLDMAIPKPPGSKRIRFAYHGVVIQDRDLPTVVRGFDIAAESHPEIELVIAGDGESLIDIKSLVVTLRHKNRIFLPGRFNPSEMTALYSSADFGVVSWAVNKFSHHTVANKFFDYAAFGKPVVFTETRPMLSLMTRMNFGVPYRGGEPQSLADAIKALLNADYDHLSQNGRDAVRREFNWENDTKKMIEFFSDILGAG